MTQFPFDEQNCGLMFSSWIYRNDTLNLDFADGISDVNSSRYMESAEWHLVATSGVRNYHNVSGGIGWFDVTFNVVVRRRPGFYIYALIIPTLLLSILTPGLFWIPPSRTDRTTLGL
jgi:nicotinic acetylcholine receptor, invertebrate